MGLRDFLGRMFKVKPEEGTIDAILAQLTDIKVMRVAVDLAAAYIADAVALSVFRAYEGDSRDESHEGAEVERILNAAPSLNMNAPHFWHSVVTRLLIEGDCLVYRKGKRFWVADSWTETVTGIGETVYESPMVNGVRVAARLLERDVIRFRLEDNPARGKLREFMKDYDALFAAAVDSAIRGGARKYKLDLSTAKVGLASNGEEKEAERRRVADSLSAFIAARVPGIIPLYQGEHLDPLEGQMAFSGARASEVISVRKDVFDLVATAMRIPPGFFRADLNAFDSMFDVFLTFAVDPVAKMMGAELTRKLCGGKSSVRLDTSGIRHVDALKQAPNLLAYLSGGHSVDEARMRLGEDPLGTEFSRRPLLTRNLTGVEPIDEAAQPVKEDF